MENRTRFVRTMLVHGIYVCLLIVGMQYTTHGSLSSVLCWIGAHFPYFVLSVVLVGGGYLFFAKVFHPLAAVIGVGFLAWLWGCINYLKFTMRDEYVTGDEVISFFKGELTFTKEDVTLSKHLAVGLVIWALVSIGAVWWWRTHKTSSKTRLRSRLCYALIAVGIACAAGYTVYFTENIYDYKSTSEELEDKYGLLLSFIPLNTTPHLITSADYEPLFSDSYVRQGECAKADLDGTSRLSDEKSDSGLTVKPNIIVIMSESLYDTDHFDNVEVDTDVMSVMHGLQAEYGGGSLAVDIFGGGTANTEYEFLTGLGHKYYAGNLMYNHFIQNGQMSMVGYMNQLGYQTVAIHPYKETFFNRKQVYDDFGFDETYFKENMRYTDDLFDVNISDESLTKEIIARYEDNRAKRDAPFFNFSVSVGAHKPCLEYDKGEPYVYDQKVSVLPKNGNFDATSSRDIQRYYNAVYDANTAFEELVSYFSKVSEPTVILLFGDHAPPLSDSAYSELTVEPLSDEELYQTPIVTWNNYGLPKFEADNVNANYLSAMFLSYLDLPLPKICVYNQNLMKYWYHSNTKKRVRDVDDNVITAFDEDEMEIEKATLSMYQDALKKKDNLLDLWDVPTQE